MKILIVEPGKHPRTANIPHKLDAMQGIVGGLIQAIYPYDDPVALVCNDEGKLMGLRPNRYIPNVDIIAGTFFICGLSKEDFSDLPDDLAAKYEHRFYYPQTFYRTPTGLAVISENGIVETIPF